MQKLSRFLVWCMALALFLPAIPALAQDAPVIAITSPQQGEVVSPTSVQVSGTASGLPENNVVVQALDDAGNLLDQEFATVQADAVGRGPGPPT